MKLNRKILTYCSALMIPIGEPAAWQDLEFRGIPKNQVSFEKGEMKIAVVKSASPLVHALKDVATVRKISAKVRLEGGLRDVAGYRQADPQFEEDSVFRLGLVIPGKKQLNAFQKIVAPAWIRRLYSLAPKGSGIERIVFLYTARDSRLLGKSRFHPSTDLMQEIAVAHRGSQESEILFTYEFKDPVKVAAIWLSCDGDDTQSSYKVRLTEIKLE